MRAIALTPTPTTAFRFFAWAVTVALALAIGSGPGPWVRAQGGEGAGAGIEAEYTLETAHFRVIYPEGLGEVASLVAEAAERAYAFWSEELGPLPPSRRIAVVLGDRSDVRRAETVFLPHEAIRLDLPLGLPRSPWGRPWDVEELLLFEVGRLLNEGRAEGLARELRGVVGRLASPGRVQPLWLREGLLYALGSRARGEDPVLEMIVRETARRGDFPTLGELSAPPGAWGEGEGWPPPELRARALGGAFLRFLLERYGEDLGKRLHEAYAAGDLRALLGGPVDAVTGRPTEELYAEFRRWLREGEGGGAAGEPPGEELPAPEGENYGLAWDPFGSSLVYEHRDPRRGAQLRRTGGAGAPEGPLLHCLCFSPAWVDGETIAYVKLTRTPDDRLLGDLYLYDVVRDRETRVTQGERIYAVAAFPDGRRLLLARNEPGGRSSLVVFDLRRRSRLIVREFGPRERVHSLAVSPDGSRLAIALWRLGEGTDTDLYTLPAEGGPLEPLTQDTARDLDPAFGPDGRFLLFASDRSGRFAIYAYEFATGRVLRVTEAAGGHFDPQPSPDGRALAFVAYGAYGRGGFRVLRVPYDPARWEPWEPEPSAPTPGAARAAGSIISRGRYDPAEDLLPTFWLPLLAGEHVGLFTRGGDPLGQHSYELALGLRPSPFDLFADVAYTNARFSPVEIRLQVTLSALGPRQRIALAFPLRRELTGERVLSLGLSHEAGVSALFLSARWLDREAFELFRRESRLGLRGGVSWRGLPSAEIPPPVRRLEIDWVERLTLPLPDPRGPHELRFRARAGWTDRAGEPFRLGPEGEYPMRSLSRPQEGRQLLWAEAEYRFPLRKALLSCCAAHPLPILGEGFEGALFVELGLAADTLEWERLRPGAGAELRIPFSLGFGLFRGQVRLGLAVDLGVLAPRAYVLLGSGSL